jgi:hypothetical protein
MRLYHLDVCTFAELFPIVFGKGDPSVREHRSDLVTQRPQGMGEFLQAKFQPRFYRSQRSVRSGGNFPVAEPLEKSELEGFPLKPR